MNPAEAIEALKNGERGTVEVEGYLVRFLKESLVWIAPDAANPGDFAGSLLFNSDDALPDANALDPFRGGGASACAPYVSDADIVRVLGRLETPQDSRYGGGIGRVEWAEVRYRYYKDPTQGVIGLFHFLSDPPSLDRRYRISDLVDSPESFRGRVVSVTGVLVGSLKFKDQGPQYLVSNESEVGLLEGSIKVEVADEHRAFSNLIASECSDDSKYLPQWVVPSIVTGVFEPGGGDPHRGTLHRVSRIVTASERDPRCHIGWEHHPAWVAAWKRK